MSEFCHFTDIYSIRQMSEYVLFYGHLSYRLDVYRSDGVTPICHGGHLALFNHQAKYDHNLKSKIVSFTVLAGIISSDFNSIFHRDHLTLF